MHSSKAMAPVFFLLLLGLAAADLEDYYEELIKSEMKRAAAYRFPKSADGYRPGSNKATEFGVYDYVVVGGGSAGSVVASRLSEMENATVLLLEAGGEETDFTDIPSMSGFTSQMEYNWGFNSTPQDTCCLAMGGVCPFPRGRALGGTSVINALIYVRGNRADYDRWGADNPGWSYADVLPFFIKSENATAISGDEGYHGFSGPLVIEHHRPSSRKLQTFLDANVELGRKILDYNGREQRGANQMQFTTVEGRRESSAKAFLKKARGRSNLKVVTQAYVTKVLVSNVTKRAYAVEFAREKKYYVVKVEKEVVLSAGVVGSSQILMHSGIGPEEQLQKLGIPAVQILSVGQNMHDHLTFYNNYFFTTHKEPSFKLRDAIKQYLNGYGPLTISTNPQGVSFFQLGFNASSSSTSPDIEVVFVPSVNMHGFDALKNGIVHGHVDEDSVNYWNKSADAKADGINYWSTSLLNNVFQVVVVLLHPKTRGEIVLQSKDPFVYPLIRSRCLVEPEDIDKVYQGVLKVLELVNTDAFQKLGPILLPYPKCIQFQMSSEEYWKCVIQQTAMNAYHGGGTCRMGADPDDGAVVDHELKVHGVKGLRVADTSVIPLTLAAHMNAPAIMIGERCADFIKNEKK